MIRYSVIIPAYNAEKTIERCLNSFVSQLRDDVEIIIVNDGSKDSTEELCLRYTSKYPQFRYLYKKNGGVSTARNLGLASSQGTYLLFVDSDDWVSNDYFTIIDRYTEDQPDFLRLSYALVNNDSRVDVIQDTCDEKTREGTLAFTVNALQKRTNNSPQGKVFKRDIITKNNLLFPEDLKIGEDKVFILAYLMNVNSCRSSASIACFLDISNEDSLSRRSRSDLPEQLLIMHRQMCCAVKSVDIPADVRKEFDRVLAMTFYRNIYIMAKELQKSSESFLLRVRKLNALCRLFNAESVKPIGWKCWLRALPQLFNAGFVIDLGTGLALQVRNKRK